jgi:L-aspartate semialdehyde sulfurtransferase
LAPVVDYSKTYPQREPDILAEVSYAELKKGRIQIQGKEIPSASLSSYSRALEIANTLKDWITRGQFLLSEPVAYLPGIDAGIAFKALNERC